LKYSNPVRAIDTDISSLRDQIRQHMGCGNIPVLRHLEPPRGAYNCECPELDLENGIEEIDLDGHIQIA
jgi:hypothetical protein